MRKSKFRMGEYEVEFSVYEFNGQDVFDTREIRDWFGYRDNAHITDSISNTLHESISKSVALSIGIEDAPNRGTSIMYHRGLIQASMRLEPRVEERRIMIDSFQQWAINVIYEVQKNNYYVEGRFITTEQIGKLKTYIDKINIHKAVLHETLYDMATTTTMSMTEAGKGIFGDSMTAKKFKKLLIEHKFFNDKGSCLIEEKGLKNPSTNEIEMTRLFCRNYIGAVKKEKDIDYHRVSNFGFMYLKKYFVKEGLANFDFSKSEVVKSGEILE